MSTHACALLAIVLSLLLLLPVALRDPKRLRSIGRPAPKPGRERTLLGWSVLLPGVVLALLAQWPAFLIWLGGVTTLAWLLVQLLARLARPLTRPG